MKQPAVSIEQLRSAVQRLPNKTLLAAREAALEDFSGHNFPSPQNEDWKYTDLSTAIDISNRWLEAGASSPASDTLSQAISSITDSIDANWVIFANGQLDLSKFSPGGTVDVERFSCSAAPTIANRPLARLNAALLLDGLRIQIHGATESPLGVLLIDHSDAGIAVSQAHIDIDIAPGIDAEIIEIQSSSGNYDCYANSVVTLHAGQGSNTRYVRVQERSLSHVQTATLDVALARDSQLKMSSFDLGGRLIRNDVNVDIFEPGSHVEFDGLYLAGDGQHIDNHTRVDHRVGPAISSQEYRGILNGRCRCVWNGKAIVHEGADGTDASQANHNLLLSEKAEIDAKPELEIYADDVKCSHGTTVGQLDETALFYLRSRGLDRQAATQLLTHAFAADLVNRTAIVSARDFVRGRVEDKLGEIMQDKLQ